MRVGVIGGTGFVGGYLVDALINSGHHPSVLVRPGSESRLRHAEQCELFAGTLSDQDSIEKLASHSDALIYNVGILRESPKQGVTFENVHYDGVVNVVDAAVKAQVKRLILMSANGISPPRTPYQDTKCRAEAYVKQSGLAYTIFRPSVIFGDPRGNTEIATQLFHDMICKPVPAIGFHTGLRPSTGSIMMSPVFVVDVASAFVNSLNSAETIGREFGLGGPQCLSWTEMLQCIAVTVGKNKTILPMPIALMKVAAMFLDWIPAFPVTRDQLTMLAAGNTTSDASLRELIDRDPVPFSTDSLAYLVS